MLETRPQVRPGDPPSSLRARLYELLFHAAGLATAVVIAGAIKYPNAAGE